MSNLWKKLRRNPTSVQTQPADPEPTTTAAAKKSDDEGLASLVEMQQAMIARMHVDIHDMTEHFKQQDQRLLEQEDELKKLKEMPYTIEYDRFELEYWRNHSGGRKICCTVILSCEYSPLFNGTPLTVSHKRMGKMTLKKWRSKSL